MFSVKGKTLLITGGASGIGYEIVRECLQRGVSNVAILDLNDKNNVIEALNKEFPGRKVIYAQTDVASAENVRQSFELAHKAFGAIDIVFGNAGMMNEFDQDRTIQVNLLGVVHSTNSAIEFMSKSKGYQGGTVVNIASVAGLSIFHSMASYTASKHGVIAFTKCMADEYFHRLHGIHMICVCPGMTDTPLMATSFNYTLDDATQLKTITKTVENQRPAEMAKCAVDILELQKNASVWIVEGGKTTEFIKENDWKPS